MLFDQNIKDDDAKRIVFVNRARWKEIHEAAAQLIAVLPPDAPPWIRAAKEALALALESAASAPAGTERE